MRSLISFGGSDAGRTVPSAFAAGVFFRAEAGAEKVARFPRRGHRVVGDGADQFGGDSGERTGGGPVNRTREIVGGLMLAMPRSSGAASWSEPSELSRRILGKRASWIVKAQAWPYSYFSFESRWAQQVCAPAHSFFALPDFGAGATGSGGVGRLSRGWFQNRNGSSCRRISVRRRARISASFAAWRGSLARFT